jgi:hypothetical protein
MAEGDGHQPRIPPTPGCTYLARERLTLGGDAIEPGQPFDHIAHGMTDLQAELWWSAAILDVAPPASAETPKPVAAAVTTPVVRPPKSVASKR